MDLFVTGASMILAGMLGFWLGRGIVWRQSEEMENPEDMQDKQQNPRRGQIFFKGQEIGAPATGQLQVEENETHIILSLFPENGRIYAPTEGRIQRLAPMGKQIFLRTETGIDIFLQAGRQTDEMFSELYRCRIMEHEYVRKGTLLLEYDTVGIKASGADPVLLMLLNKEELRIRLCHKQGYIKAGATVLYADDEKRMVLYEKNS